MPPTLNNDIFLHIVDEIAAEWRTTPEPETYVFGAYELGSNRGPKTCLLRLRQTCRFLAAKITPLFFSNILINRIDVRNARRLACIMRSTFIPPSVMSYTLRPEIVHTAPSKSLIDIVNPSIELLVENSGLPMLCAVVKSSIWEYYGDLDRSCGPEPRYSELEAEHQMRQRVKAHWDEQQRFLYPDYGRLSYTIRSRMQWLFGPLARTSALHSSVFLTAVDRLETLVELKVSYSVPRDIPIVGTIAKDMSFGLGRYLAGSRGRRLKILRLELVHSSDLELLLSALCPETPLLHQPPIETSMPGSWPLNECNQPPPSNVRLDLQLETLEIIFAHDDSPPAFKSSSLAEDLGRLLSYTGKLSFLELTCPFSYRITDLMPSLVGLRVPPLIYLTKVIMENMYVDSGAILSLLMHNQPSLKTLNILGVYLQGGTWAEIGKALAGEKSLEGLKFDRTGYLGSDGELRGLSGKDWMFWKKC